MEVLLILLVILAIYFFPTICAWGKSQAGSVFVLNLFLGWTLIGWVVALAIAAAPSKEGHQVSSIKDSTTMQENTKVCPFCAEAIKKEAIICRFCNRELDQCVKSSDDIAIEDAVNKKEDLANKKLVTGWELTGLAANSMFWTFGLPVILVVSCIGIIGWTMNATNNKESVGKPAQEITTDNNISSSEQQAILPDTAPSENILPPATAQEQPQDNLTPVESPAVLATSQEPIVLEGKGNQVTRKFYLESGLATINYSVTHNHDAGDSEPTNFILSLKSSDGEDIDCVANQIVDNIDESQAVTAPVAGTYIFNVNAVGNWKIEVSQ